MSAFVAIVGRDVRLAFRAGGGSLQGALFFAITALIFALAIGADLATLSRLAAPILWACALLSTLVSLERIFQADAEDGSLDVIVETADPLEIAFLAKAAAHWLTASLPLIAAAPVIGVLLNLPGERFAPLLVSLLVGTPALSLIGALGAALTLSLKRAGVLVTILIAPLYAPTLIFGVAASGGLDAPMAASALLFLGAATMFSLIIAALAGAAAIRMNMI